MFIAECPSLCAEAGCGAADGLQVHGSNNRLRVGSGAAGTPEGSPTAAGDLAH